MPLQPDFLLLNAHIITMDPAHPVAGWVAARDGKIMTVGAAGETPPAASNVCHVMDCRGATVLPGFVDAHLHLLSVANSLICLNLAPSVGVRTISDIQSLIAQRSRQVLPGEWIRARGYHEFDLAEKRSPDRHDLDAAAPCNPVLLTHRTGHAHVLNSLGLRLAGIGLETGDPDGGLIDRDPHTGLPTGVLYEMSGTLSNRLPRFDEEEIERGLHAADRWLLSCGITSIQDASARNGVERLHKLLLWKQRGLITPRLHAMPGMDGFRELDPGGPSTAPVWGPVSIGAVKIILNETTGQLYPPQEQLDEWVLAVHRSHMQVAIHAIEETAIESACTAIDRALRQIPRRDHRHRIEHCSVCPPFLADRIAILGIRVVSQPAFIHANGNRYLDTVPSEKIKYLYPFGALMNKGIRMAAGSDGPTVPIAPWKAIGAAVTRRSAGGRLVQAEEAIQVPDALRMYTLYGAETTFSEGSLGSITPGKWADMILLDRDPFRIPPDELRRVKVDMTIINGQVVWTR